MSRTNKAGFKVRAVLVILLAVLVTGCSSALRVVEKPVMVERQRLIVPEIQPVEQIPLEWIVITRYNFEAKVREAEERGSQIVLFALTPDGYQNLSINVAEMRRFVVQQRSTLAAYREYYENPPEPPKQSEIKKDKPFWKFW